MRKGEYQPTDWGGTVPIQRALRNATVSSFVVYVLEGPDRGASFTIDANSPSRVLVGTGPTCDFKLTDPRISRRHLALDAENARLRVTDLGSTNGTYVGHVSLVEAIFFGGERVRLGDTLIEVRMDQNAAAEPESRAARFGRLVGASPEMRRLYPLCERLAASDVPVLIEGETGTGKEQLAEAIHEASARAGKPFIVFDCTAVAPNLLESTLFGHEKGAFTGAVAARRGVFEQAHGGTLLVDEVGDLDLTLQPKLLRAVQRGEVQRVGSEKWMKVDVRLLSATRRNLDAEVQAARFRDDLFFRIAVTRIELPPLRRRRGDVRLLAAHFWRTLGGESQPIPDDFLDRLEAYAWPGNVRELYNAVARRLALGDLAPSPDAAKSPVHQEARVDGSLEGWIERTLESDLSFPHARSKVIEAFEKIYIERVLAQHGGNVVRAAAASGIARRYFQILKARQKTM